MQSVTIHYDSTAIKGITLTWGSDTSGSNALTTTIGYTVDTLQTEIYTLAANEKFFGFSGSYNPIYITSLSLLVQDPDCSVDQPDPVVPVDPVDPVNPVDPVDPTPVDPTPVDPTTNPVTPVNPNDGSTNVENTNINGD